MIDDERERRGGIGTGDGGPGSPGKFETVVQRAVGPGETVGDAVLESVTALCETDAGAGCALDMSPMYETLDVDALSALYTGAGSDSVSVEFRHAGYRFTVTDDEIVVEDADGPGDDDEEPGH